MSVAEFSLAGKRAVVIAGSRGVGLGITLAFAEAGADVAVAGLTQANADKAADRVRALGWQAWSYAVDATDDSQMRTFAEAAIAEFGPFDAVVNCLGEHYPAVVAKRPGREEAVAIESLWREIIDVNLTEAFLGCHYFAPRPTCSKGGRAPSSTSPPCTPSVLVPSSPCTLRQSPRSTT